MSRPLPSRGTPVARSHRQAPPGPREGRSAAAGTTRAVVVTHPAAGTPQVRSVPGSANAGWPVASVFCIAGTARKNGSERSPAKAHSPSTPELSTASTPANELLSDLRRARPGQPEPRPPVRPDGAEPNDDRQLVVPGTTARRPTSAGSTWNRCTTAAENFDDASARGTTSIANTKFAGRPPRKEGEEVADVALRWATARGPEKWSDIGSPFRRLNAAANRQAHGPISRPPRRAAG